MRCAVLTTSARHRHADCCCFLMSYTEHSQVADTGHLKQPSTPTPTDPTATLSLPDIDRALARISEEQRPDYRHRLLGERREHKLGGRVAPPASDPSQATGRVKRRDNQLHCARVLEVRIQSPPAASQQRTVFQVLSGPGQWQMDSRSAHASENSSESAIGRNHPAGPT